MMGWGCCEGWGMPFFGAGWLLLILIAVVAVIFLARRTRGNDEAPPQASSREILDRRYAAGEITKEQYAEMKSDLGI